MFMDRIGLDWIHKLIDWIGSGKMDPCPSLVQSADRVRKTVPSGRTSNGKSPAAAVRFESVTITNCPDIVFSLGRCVHAGI